MNTLRNFIVAVFEVGGVGSYAVETLARCGVGRLILASNDTISLTNVGRQGITLRNTIGQFRTRVIEEKIADICPGTQVIAFEELVLPDNIENLFEHMELQMGQGNSVDYIPDAINTVTTKLALAGFVASHGIPVITSMGTGNKLHPESLRVSGISRTSVCPLCRVMHEELEVRNISGLKVCWSSEQPLTLGQTTEDTGCRRATPKSISLVPPVARLVIARAIVRDIYGLE